MPQGSSSSSNKTIGLQAAVEAIRGRWGPSALGKADISAAKFPHVPTGFPALDRALGIGGIPRGRVTEILGAPTSGTATLALKVIASAQAEGDMAAYIDLGCTLDPDYAARCGIDTGRLLLALDPSPDQALEIARDLVASGGAGVLVFDSVAELLKAPNGARTMSAGLRRLAGTLGKSPCALVFLTPLHPNDHAGEAHPSGTALSHYATLRLLIEKERWIRKRRDVRGYKARVKVIKNRLAPDGGQVLIRITFNGVVEGDGT